MEKYKIEAMRKAIRLSQESIGRGGGPFGAVILKDGKEVVAGANEVTQKNDPTAHAEVTAIREAAKTLGTFNLAGCEIYSSCEPCPMCLSAIYWARIDKLYYANTKDDAKWAGFDDSFIYQQLALPEDQRSIPVVRMMRDEAIEAFKVWNDKENKIKY
jgi:Cytosine/adenosine deaminases